MKTKKYLSGKRILPKPISSHTDVVSLINHLDAYNGGRLRAACELLVQKYADENVTIGLSLAGALSPAGLGVSAIIPLMNHGFVDWITTTGANMYHDLHFAFNLPLHRGSPDVDDADLRKKGVVRIYDILFDHESVLLETDKRLQYILLRPEFQKEMGTREFYYLLGKVVNEYEQKHGLGQVSILAAAYRNDIPIFTPAPGDSTIGMNIASLELLAEALNLTHAFRLKINPSRDVNESTTIVWNAKRDRDGKSAVILLGGGSPKNFMLQTEPQLQEILRLQENGHDYDINVTDARPDTGGLSGAPPREAASWGKIDPEKIEESVTVYVDVTVAFPLMVAYVLQKTKPKKLKRLAAQMGTLYEALKNAYLQKGNEVKRWKTEMEKLKEK